MPEIMEIARRHHLAVIEDAAHAPGAALEGRALAPGGCRLFQLLFQQESCHGEGGMLVTNRDDIAEVTKTLRSHGMTTLTWDRHHGHAHTYDVVHWATTTGWMRFARLWGWFSSASWPGTTRGAAPSLGAIEKVAASFSFRHRSAFWGCPRRARPSHLPDFAS